jgi:hypothetical protein
MLYIKFCGLDHNFIIYRPSIPNPNLLAPVPGNIRCGGCSSRRALNATSRTTILVYFTSDSLRNISNSRERGWWQTVSTLKITGWAGIRIGSIPADL